MMGHDKLANYYKTNFGMIEHHHWRLEELENMLPWERYAYIDMLQEYLREEEKKAKQREQENKAKWQQMQRTAMRR